MIVLVKIRDDHSPIIRFAELMNFLFFTVFLQYRDNRIGPFAVLVVMVVKDNPHARAYFSRGVGIGKGNGRSFRHDTGDRIAFRDSAFIPAVIDFLSVLILRKIPDRRTPLVRFIQCRRHAVT